MGMVRIKKADMADINVYMELSGAIVKHEAGRWIISTPEETIIFETLDGLLEDIRANLDIMRELVEDGQIEREIWEAAWNA